MIQLPPHLKIHAPEVEKLYSKWWAQGVRSPQEFSGRIAQDVGQILPLEFNRAHLLWMGYRLAHGGKLFEVCKELTAALVHTDVPLSLPVELANPPFPACVFTFGEGKEQQDVSIISTEGSECDYHLSWKSRGEVEHFAISVVHARSIEEIGLSQVINIDAGQRKWSEIRALLGAYLNVEEVGPTGRSIPQGQSILSLAINTLVYINSTSVRREEMFPPEYYLALQKLPGAKGKKKKRAEELVARFKSRGWIRIGFNPPPAPANEATRGKISTRFQVRGHFNSYWMNKAPEGARIVREKGGKQLVVKWLQPFWKGPEFAQQVERNYKVK